MSIDFTLRLYGNSTFWVFTRLPSNHLEPLAPVIIIRKQVGSQRLFCIMGALGVLNRGLDTH